ncbi:MAG: hypothetical protein HOW73_21555 [Polyangiaceae bacterium]|nr:hypothetical protein [Polyangiaceae bacterium]
MNVEEARQVDEQPAGLSARPIAQKNGLTYVERRLVPAELSYCELEPGPGIAPFWSGIAVLLGLKPPVPIANGPVSLTMMRHARLRRVALQIVPWGIVTATVHGWGDISQLVHESVQQAPGTNDRGWPHRKSFVYTDIGGERFQSVCDFQPTLDKLPKLIRSFAAEAERPIALDLEGKDGIDPEDTGVFRRVLSSARNLAQSDLGTTLVDVATDDYRSMSRTLREDGIEMLRAMLRAYPKASDTAPLASILAAELHATPLIPELVGLMRSPSPFVASVARAAAIRLGSGTGAFRRYRALRSFLEDSEVRAIEAWTEGG